MSTGIGISSRGARRPTRAFTLVELTVVVGILAVLIGLTLAVGVGLSRRARESETRDMLRILDAAYNEWKTATGRDVTYGNDGEPAGGERYEFKQSWVQDPDPQNLVDELTPVFLFLLAKPTEVQDILAQLDDDRVRRIDFIVNGQTVKTLEILDSWDIPIRIIMPGRPWVATDGYTLDDDGTIRTAWEAIHGIAVNRRPYFVSAGPDATFGDLTYAEGDPFHEAAHDNLYSYEVIAHE